MSDAAADLVVTIAVAVLNTALMLGLIRVRQLIRLSANVGAGPILRPVLRTSYSGSFGPPAIQRREEMSPPVPVDTDANKTTAIVREFEGVLETYLERRDRRQKWSDLLIAALTFVITIAAEELLRLWVH